MIVHKIRCALTALKHAIDIGVEHLILDLDESLDPMDVIYAWFKCGKCGAEAHVGLGEELPKKCLCGGLLYGLTADIVVQGCMVLYNHDRERPETFHGSPCDGCYYTLDNCGNCPGEHS